MIFLMCCLYMKQEVLSKSARLRQTSGEEVDKGEQRKIEGVEDSI